MWKKMNHKWYPHYWVNNLNPMYAAIDRVGCLMVWTRQGQYNSVQCKDTCAALKLFNQTFNSSEND